MSSAIVTFVVNAAWQSSAAALFGLLVARLSRVPAATRYVLAIGAFVVALVLPALSLIQVPGPAASRLVTETGLGGPEKRAVGESAMASSTPLSMIGTAEARAIAIAYCAIVVLAGIRLALRWRRARTLLRMSRPLSAAGAVQICESRYVTTPMTMGSTIILPAFLRDEALRMAAIRHELAHLRGRDYTVNLMIELLALPLAFHPIVFLLRRAINELRELRCDDVAAANERGAYARALVAIARLAVRRDLAMGMATTALERRIASLRDAAPPRARGLIWVAAIALATIAVTACRYSLHPAIGEEANLSGSWRLDRAASDFGPIAPYSTFDQRIEQRGRSLRATQHRVSDEGVLDRTWSVWTDDAPRAIPDIPQATGRAAWKTGRLELVIDAPGQHEQSVAYLTEGGRRLVCEGMIKGRRSGRYRIVFWRESSALLPV